MTSSHKIPPYPWATAHPSCLRCDWWCHDPARKGPSFLLIGSTTSNIFESRPLLVEWFVGHVMLKNQRGSSITLNGLNTHFRDQPIRSHGENGTVCNSTMDLLHAAGAGRHSQHRYKEFACFLRSSVACLSKKP